MGKILWRCALLVAIALACEPAQAGDRKFARRGKDAALLRYKMAEVAAAKSFETRPSAGERSSEGREKQRATTPSERKDLTFFRFNSQFGDVAVQPVMGQVNGAQFSLGF